MDQFEPPAAAPPPPVGPEQPASSMPSPSLPLPPETKKRRRAPLFIAIAVLLVVAIVVAIAATSGGKKASAASTSPSATVAPRPTVPGSLQAKAGAFQVALSWSPSTGDFIGYRIFRDGSALDVVAAPNTTYTDSHALPTSTYSYAVEAYSQSGNNSERAVMQVTTPKGLLSAARLTGVYNVRLKTTSQFGLTAGLGAWTDGWRFKPVCSTGVCDVAWNELGHKELGARLKRSGTSYHGTDPSSATASCNGVHVNGSVEVTIKVLKAAVVGDKWVATAIEGTQIVRSPASLGCVNSGVDFSFTAKLVR